MTDLIILGILIIIIGAASIYIVKAKRKGIKCIGCPAAGNCPSKNCKTGACSCGGHSDMGEK